MSQTYKTLIVDDSISLRTVLAICLKDSEFEVVGQAADGRAAIEKYKELRPDFVLCDIVMPEMTGTDALREIIAFDPNAFIVMASSMGTQKHVEECLEIGAKGFIQKPFNKDEVLPLLRSIVQGKAG